MMSSNINKSDSVVFLKNLFYEGEIGKEIVEILEKKPVIQENENLVILKEIQEILQNCSNLSEKQKLEYCESQRYFMKLYLQELKNQNNLF